jgi:hypothetical protein
MLSGAGGTDTAEGRNGRPGGIGPPMKLGEGTGCLEERQPPRNLRLHIVWFSDEILIAHRDHARMAEDRPRFEKIALPQPQWCPVAGQILAMTTGDHVTRITQHADDVKMPVKPKASAHRDQLARPFAEIDGEVPADRKDPRFMLVEGIDRKGRDHHLRHKGRAGARSKAGDVNAFHRLLEPALVTVPASSLGEAVGSGDPRLP